MNKNVARFIAGPLGAAGLAAGALGFATAANADDPVQVAPDLFSAHSGVIFANAAKTVPSPIDGGIRVTELAVRSNGLRRPCERLAVNALIAEIREVDLSAVDHVCAASVFVNCGAYVETGRCDVG